MFSKVGINLTSFGEIHRGDTNIATILLFCVNIITSVYYLHDSSHEEIKMNRLEIPSEREGGRGREREREKEREREREEGGEREREMGRNVGERENDNTCRLVLTYFICHFLQLFL